jgi:Spy/CpxP family protein refolding chaperone
MSRALQWKLIAGFVLVFIAGGTTGAFLATAHARHLFVQSHQAGFVATRMKERMRAELDLTPDQVARISPILDKTANQLQQIRNDTGRRVHQTIIESHQQISAILTEDQKKKLQQMEMRHRRWLGFHHRGPGMSPEERPGPDSHP